MLLQSRPGARPRAELRPSYRSCSFRVIEAAGLCGTWEGVSVPSDGMVSRDVWWLRASDLHLLSNSHNLPTCLHLGFLLCEMGVVRTPASPSWFEG